MKKGWKIVLFTLSLGFTLPIFSQHGMQYSLYMHERYGFNPAFGGMDGSLAAGLLYRTQWAGLDGNPESRMINVHMPFYLWQGAIGFQLLSESIGAEKQTGFLLSYNYIYESSVGLISTGIRAGISQNSLDGTKLIAPDGEYQGGIFNHQDANLPNGKVSGISPVLEAGVYFAGDYFESGFSMTGFYPAGIKLEDEVDYAPRPVFHFFGEYFIEPFDEVSFYPVAYVKSDLTQTQAELSIRAEWQNFLTVGLGYRGFGQNSQDAMILSAGVRLSSKFFLHYAYDIGLSSLQTTHDGTHELLISYNLGKRIGAGLPPRIIYNPRNL
jgi:type IX secretion system PorP/SprF family membrane protein